MSKRTLLGSAASFAHLFGRGTAAKKSETEEEERRGRKAEDEKDDKHAAAEDEDDDAERCEDEGDDADASAAEDEDDDDEDEKEKKTKKGKKAKSKKAAEDDDKKPDDEDEDEDDDEGNEDARQAERAGRKAERARWTRVMSHPAAGEGRVGLACKWLATTNSSASTIIGLLKETPKASRGAALAERMAGVSVANPGSGGGDGKGPNLADQIILAGKKRRGEA